MLRRHENAFLANRVLAIRSLPGIDSQTVFQFPSTTLRHAQRTSTLTAGQPPAGQHAVEQRRAECAGQMRFAFGPVQTATGELTSPALQRTGIDIQGGEPLRTTRSYGVVTVSRWPDHFQIFELLGDRNAELARQMVIARARTTKLGLAMGTN